MKRIIIWTLVGGFVGLVVSNGIADQLIEFDPACCRDFDSAWARYEDRLMNVRSIVMVVGLVAGGLLSYMLQRSRNREWRLIGAWKYPQIYEGDDTTPPPPLLKP